MNNQITLQTKFKEIKPTQHRTIMNLVTQFGWEDLAMALVNRHGKNLYNDTQLCVIRNQASIMCKDPVKRIFDDWKMSNPTLGDLVKICESIEYFAITDYIYDIITCNPEDNMNTKYTKTKSYENENFSSENQCNYTNSPPPDYYSLSDTDRLGSDIACMYLKSQITPSPLSENNYNENIPKSKDTVVSVFSNDTEKSNSTRMSTVSNFSLRNESNDDVVDEEISSNRHDYSVNKNNCITENTSCTDSNYNNNLESASSVNENKKSSSASITISTKESFIGFTFDEIKEMTNNFNCEPFSKGGNLIGSGGFGDIYHAIYNSKSVAVKRFRIPTEMFRNQVDSAVRQQYNMIRQQFIRELSIFWKFHHKYLLNVIGYSKNPDDSFMCIVTEFMFKGSLDDCLRNDSKATDMTFDIRFSILHKVAQAVCYLHNGLDGEKFAHRDIKPGNILLDSNYQPKLADFGLTRTATSGVINSNTTLISTNVVVGSKPYMPEEACTKYVTTKYDTYSFGVVIIETVTGMTTTQNPNVAIIFEINFKPNSENISQFDKRLENSFPKYKEKLQIISELSIHCRAKMFNRPTMDEVCEQLNKIQN